MLSKKLRLRVRRLAKPVGLALGLITVFLFLYCFKLGTFVPGLSQNEVTARTSSSSAKTIIMDPLYGPHKFAQYALRTIGFDGHAGLRGASVFFAAIAVASFFATARWWFGKTIAIYTTILFATTPWILINGRSATPAILLTAPLAIFAAYLWLVSTTRFKDESALLFVIILAGSLYVPGIIWVIIVASIFFNKQILALLKDTSRYIFPATITLFVLMVSPLIFAIAVDLEVGRRLLLIPGELDLSTEAVSAIAWSALGIVWRTRDNLPQTLGFAPVLDAFSTAMAIIGAAKLLSEVKRRRTYALLGALGATIVVAGINKNYEYTLLAVPIVFIFIAAGIDYLRSEWLRVFPRNPFAKWAGLIAIAIVIGASVIYGVRYSLVAWPKAPETKQLYMLQ